MSIQALREQRAAKAKSLNDLVNKADWNADADQPIYDAGMNELDAIDSQIKRINDLNAKVANDAMIAHVAERSERAGVDNKSEGARVYAKWLRGGDKALNANDWQIVNTMSTTTSSEGGYTVATEVATSVLDALKAYGGMRLVAEVIQTSQGNPMQFPTSDGTAEVGEIVAENAGARLG
jgi:HK97 family phage major capsid protein